MSSLRPILIALLAVLTLVRPGLAGELGVFDTEDGLGLRLELESPVPWRAFTLDAPPRLVVDLKTEAGLGGLADNSERVTALRSGAFQEGWSRVVVDLAGPFAIETAAFESGAPVLGVRLTRVPPQIFAARSGTPEAARVLPEPSRSTPPAQDTGLRVMLDPGHGGVDPGAEAGGSARRTSC